MGDGNAKVLTHQSLSSAYGKNVREMGRESSFMKFCTLEAGADLLTVAVAAKGGGFDVQRY